MARDFTNDDRGKDVFDHQGNLLGSVSDVQDGHANVNTRDNDSGIFDEIKSALGWDDNDDSHELRNNDVETINDTEVRLRQL